jgi:hypothetical protein
MRPYKTNIGGAGGRYKRRSKPLEYHREIIGSIRASTAFRSTKWCFNAAATYSKKG